MRLDILYAGPLTPHPDGTAISGSQILVGLAGYGHRIRAVSPVTAEDITSAERFARTCPAVEITRFLVPHSHPSSPLAADDEYRMRERAESRRLVARLAAADMPDLLVVGRESFAWELPGLAKSLSLPCVVMSRGGTTMDLLANGDPRAHELLAQLNAADLVVCTAHHLARRLAELSVTHSAVVLNAVDTESFRPEPRDQKLATQLGIGSGDIVVAHVSNLREQKWPLDVVASAVDALQHRRDLVYVIVGDGPFRQAMEELCSGHGIASRVRFVGWVEYEAVPKFVNLADIVVMPSRIEGQARAYLETMACGRTLIASDIPGAREVVRDGETGLLFRKGEVDDLVAKTLLAAADPQLRGAIGRKAREYAATRPIHRAVPAYEELFVNVVRSRRRDTVRLASGERSAAALAE